MTTQVLHVIARMNVGGTARYVGELIEKIPENRLATGHVQASEIEDPCVQKLNVMRIPHMGRKISPLNDFLAWIELRKIIKEVKPAIVHTHTFKAGLIGRLIGGKHKRVHTFHGHLFDDHSFSPVDRFLIRVAEEFLANRTDLLISIGSRVGIELRLAGIGTDKQWISIAPGVNKLPFVEKRQARRALGLKEEGLLFGWMARMAEVKNPHLLLKIATQMPEVSFVMAGGGNLLDQIKIQAPKNVVVLGWSDAALFWSAVDCAISTSDNEGMPISLIEAQLAGIPVIATDVGSTSEVIKDGTTGILTKSNELELIQAVNRFVMDNAMMEKIGIASKKYASKEFSVEKMIESHKKAYLQLL